MDAPMKLGAGRERTDAYRIIRQQRAAGDVILLKTGCAELPVHLY